MFGFDLSIEEGMCNFRGFVNNVKQGGTGRRGRNFVPTPAPYNGVQIELGQESIFNPLHLHMKVFDPRVAKAQRFHR